MMIRLAQVGARCVSDLAFQNYSAINQSICRSMNENFCFHA